MFCQCSINHNYEIISLCDVKSFVKQNGPFHNKAWIQISIPEILSIPLDKPKIENIQKVYVKVSISGIKLINTPKSTAPNAEGMILTGKKLLVDGYICEKIVYTSLTDIQSVHSLDFNIPFCTHIVLEENVDIFNDIYCVKTCLEDVFISPICSSNIFQNITLFLVAIKKVENCINRVAPSDCTINVIQNKDQIVPTIINSLPNTIFVDSINDEEVITIKFDKDTNKIIVNSTEVIPDDKVSEGYFSFILNDKFGVEKIRATLKSNEMGNDFKTILNGVDFEFGDSIRIAYMNNSKIGISNYPNKSTRIYKPKGTDERFIITDAGLIGFSYANEITINNDSSVEVAKIKFNINNNLLNVTSTGVQCATKIEPIEEYLSFILFNDRFDIIEQGKMFGKETAFKFTNDLNNKRFSNGNVIKLRYKFRNNINISNYRKEERYKPAGRFEFFKINSNSLVPYYPQFLDSEIRLKNEDGSYVLNILLDVGGKIVILDSTGTPNDNLDYFSFKILDSSGMKVKFTGLLRSDEIADEIFNIDNQKFEFGDIIELTYSNPPYEKGNELVEITNFPTMDTALYYPNKDSERFRITATALEPVVILQKNTITFFGLNNSEIARVNFDTNTKQLKIISTGTVANTNFTGQEYFAFILKNKDKTVKIASAVQGEENGDNFKNTLNNNSFEYNDIITVRYKEDRQISISNMPNTGDTYYTLNEREKNFVLTTNGIILLT